MLDAGLDESVHRQAAKLSFGPWREVTLLDLAKGHDFALNLQSGKLITPPPDILKLLVRTVENGWPRRPGDEKEIGPIMQWVSQSDIDVIGTSPPVVLIFGAIQQDSETINPLWNPPMGNWITPEWILWTLDQHQKWLKLRKTDGKPLLSPGRFGVDPKRLVIFQTREDCRGILQIFSAAGKPEGVKIRYRLVQESGQEPSAAAESASERTAEPQGGVLTYEVEPGAASAGAAAPDMDKLLKAIDQRLNAGPERLAQVRKLDDGRIEVALMRDNDKDRQRVERLLSKPGTLEFRILANERDNKELIEQARKEPSKTEVRRYFRQTIGLVGARQRGRREELCRKPRYCAAHQEDGSPRGDGDSRRRRSVQRDRRISHEGRSSS